MLSTLYGLSLTPGARDLAVSLCEAVGEGRTCKPRAAIQGGVERAAGEGRALREGKAEET